MACSPKPLQDLSKHFSVVNQVPLPSYNNNSNSNNQSSTKFNLNNNNSTFRSNSINTINSLSNSSKRQIIGNEFNMFSGVGGGSYSNNINYSNNSTLSNLSNNNKSIATTQIQEMPPNSFHSPRPRNLINSSTTNSSILSIPHYPQSLLEPNDDLNSDSDLENEEESSEWNPESITQHYISTHSVKPTYLNSTYAPASQPSLGPNFEEALRISATPPPLSLSSSSTASTSQLSIIPTYSTVTDSPKNGTTATPPHPLTYTTPSHSAWDYSKLFSDRRRWYGGVRLPGSTLFDSASDSDSTSHSDSMEIIEDDNGNSMKGGNSSGLRNQVGTGAGEEIKQAEIFEGLRKVAMARLKAVSNHFV